MAATPFIIQERQFQRIKSILARLCVECAARVVFLVDRDGQPIAFHGDIGDMDTTSFSSLAAGNVAATTSMAKLIGEDEFPAVVHEGERESIYIGVIGRSLLVVVFDERSTVGLVKIRSKRASFEVAAAIEEVVAESSNFRNNNNSFFAEITDEDIDSLFAQ
jgi:predicted regulator of Ras-like GTPase activity (Roadblock/LC7/MglB family)